MPIRSLAALVAAIMLGAACQAGGGASPTTVVSPSVASPPAASESAAASQPAESPAGNPEDLLARVRAAGVIRVSTDPAYPPQSELKPDGTYEGFDIDVAEAIAKELGVEVEYETPSWDAITAGNWSGRWDISVGSMTITTDRKEVLDFSEPYYYTPAQMAASEASGITTLDGLAGKTVCVGEATTYLDWLEGDLQLEDGGEVAEPPEGVKSTTLPTDRDCADAIGAGRTEFEGWLSSSTTVQDAIDDGIPIVTVGDPVFYEPLAVALDKSGPPHAELLAEIDRIITEMHEDGTLSESSKKWFDGLDLTEQAGM
jgi:polar amino acid transport system substrate-binding protein